MRKKWIEGGKAKERAKKKKGAVYINKDNQNNKQIRRKRSLRMRTCTRTYHAMLLWLRKSLSKAGRVSISCTLSTRFLLMFSSVRDLKPDRFDMHLMRLPRIDTKCLMLLRLYILV